MYRWGMPSDKSESFLKSRGVVREMWDRARTNINQLGLAVYKDNKDFFSKIEITTSKEPS